MRTMHNVLAVGLLAAATAAVPAQALTFETGMLYGLNIITGPGTSNATGTFVFDSGAADFPGVDYAAATTPNPGTFSVSTIGYQNGTWSGAFTATNLVFGSTSGVYSYVGGVQVGTEISLTGPITFNATPPLPPGLTDLAFASNATVTDVVYGGPYFVVQYSFQGPFQLTAIPEPGSLTLLALGLCGLALASRRSERKAGSAA